MDEVVTIGDENMVVPIVAAAGIAGAASLGSAFLGASSNRSANAAQSRMNKPFQQTQERKNRLIDELLASLNGSGRYSDLFKTDEAAFQKSFVDPAKARFNNQIAPQIQQNSIANGMQKSSTLDDQLLRAGVDMDQMLNSHYMQFQNQGKDRMQHSIDSILGAGSP
jgi:hypothetical protein